MIPFLKLTAGSKPSSLRALTFDRVLGWRKKLSLPPDFGQA